MDNIPLFLERGVTGMYPFEASGGMDIVQVRKQYPPWQMMRGVPKSEIACGIITCERSNPGTGTLDPSIGWFYSV